MDDARVCGGALDALALWVIGEASEIYTNLSARVELLYHEPRELLGAFLGI